MTNVDFARAQMGTSLAFHIVFAVSGIGMPLLMAIAEGLHLRTKNPVYLELAKRWARGTAILFAVGAVSGTVLSFELGLLWPEFMRHAGPVIGMPFSLEGFAFFTEAIFLGVFLYGWDRLSPVAHWISGIIVAISGAASAVFVVAANSWMNTPTGFRVANGEFTDIDPIAALFNPAGPHQIIHMVLAAYAAIGFAVAGVHAWFLLKDRQNAFHRGAFLISAMVACISIPLQTLSGDFAAKRVGKLQPAKLAAMEAHYHTRDHAPLVVGGIPDDAEAKVRYAMEIPAGLSMLMDFSPSTVVTGLDAFPRDQWPNVAWVHWSFDLMLACGMFMMLVAVWAGFTWWRTRSLPVGTNLLRAFVICTPLGLFAVETGWCVTEFGRQPWTIYGFLRTADAATPMPNLYIPFTVFTIVYLFLSVILFYLLKRQFLETAPSKLIAENDHA